MDDLTSLRFRRLRKNKSHDDRVSERPLRAPCVKQCEDQHIPRQSSLPVSPPVHHRLHQVSSLHHHHHHVAQVSAVRQVSGHHSPLVRRHETLNKEKTTVNAARRHAEEVGSTSSMLSSPVCLQSSRRSLDVDALGLMHHSRLGSGGHRLSSVFNLSTRSLNKLPSSYSSNTNLGQYLTFTRSHSLT